MTEGKPIEDNGGEAVVEPAPISSAVETAVDSSAESRPRLALHPRHRSYGLLAASVAIAAAFGALIGSAATGAFSKPAALNVANVEEDKSIQQSVARLSKEMTSLKANSRGREQVSAKPDREDQRTPQPRAHRDHRLDHATADHARECCSTSDAAPDVGRRRPATAG